MRVNYTYTKIIIWINVAIFFLFYASSFFIDPAQVFMLSALTPSLLIGKYYIWTLVTSMFLHTLPIHLFFNMISLFFIGRFVEPLIGRKRFMTVFFLSGILAGLLHVGVSYWASSGLDVPAIGASGAIMGLVGLLAVLIPRQKVLLFFVIPMPLWFFGVLLLALVIFNPQIGGVAIGHIAHLGGFAAGALYGLYIAKKYPQKVQMLRQVYN